MSKIITAIVLDGFHAGHVVRMSYHPTLELLKPKVIKVDYCCGGDEVGPEEPETIEYKECFRAVDRDVVLFSEKGESLSILGMFPWEREKIPWTVGTTLKMGYHNEPILREDDGTEITEYDKGYARGVIDGKIARAKEEKH
jgi:hypothetical protein